MDADAVATVRRFNRRVTTAIGVLDDEYLDRGRSLAASRVIWEVGDDGEDIRSLRSRLGLDSGYLSRLLRALEQEGLVEVAADEVDGRVRTVRRTPAGQDEYDVLDRLNDEKAWSLLDPLTEAQRTALVDAMAVVQRLLTAGVVEIGPADPNSADASVCLNAYFAEIDERFDGGFDFDSAEPFDGGDMVEPEGLLLLARLDGRPIGCGALHFFPDGLADLKRMWVDSSARGIGLGRRMLTELETEARAHGVTLLRLETNQSLVEAIAMYHATGFAEVDPFNDEVHAHHWFAKPLN